MGKNKNSRFGEEEIVSGLYEELNAMGKKRLNAPVFVSATSFENPTTTIAGLDKVTHSLSRRVLHALGPLQRGMEIVVVGLSIEKSQTEDYYTTRARVSYMERSPKSEDSVEQVEESDEAKYLFLSKENPELAIDMVESSSSGKEIEYHALAPHEGCFGDVHYFSLSEVEDYNLDNFWAIPVAEGELATWVTVISFLNKDR